MSISSYKKKYNYFDSIYSAPHFVFIRTIESVLMSEFLANSKQPLLDLGCGDGIFANSLGMSDVHGIDILIPPEGRFEGYLSARQADAAEIPFDNSYFGTVFSNCAMEHMDNLPVILTEIKRVLKPEGQLLLTVPDARFIDLFKANSMLKAFELNTLDNINNYNMVHHHVNIMSVTAWAERLKSAGFSIISHHYYLPDQLAEIVIYFDVLYTLRGTESESLIKNEESKQFRGLGGLRLRRKLWQYLLNWAHVGEGSHIFIKAKVTNEL